MIVKMPSCKLIVVCQDLAFASVSLVSVVIICIPVIRFDVKRCSGEDDAHPNKSYEFHLYVI